MSSNALIEVKFSRVNSRAQLIDANRALTEVEPPVKVKKFSHIPNLGGTGGGYAVFTVELSVNGTKEQLRQQLSAMGFTFHLPEPRTGVFLDPADKTGESWRAEIHGRLQSPTWNSKGAAQAYVDAVLRGERKQEAIEI